MIGSNVGRVGFVDDDGDFMDDRDVRGEADAAMAKDPSQFYRDPVTGKVHQGSAALGAGIQPAKTNALFADPTAAPANMAFFGGDQDAAGRQYGRQVGLANAVGNREDLVANWGMTNEAMGLQKQGYDGLARAAAGDPHSVAQGDLRGGFARSNLMASSGAAGARGGMAARSLARRTAGNQIAGNAGAQAIASADLMNQERLAAMPQLMAAANQVRGQTEGIAGINARVNQDNWEMDREAELDFRGRGIRAAGMGMQGEMAWQGARRNIAATGAGLSNAMDVARQQGEARDINTGLGVGTGLAQGVGAQIGRNKPMSGSAPNHNNDIIRRNPY